jgi:hypothetical protein
VNSVFGNEGNESLARIQIHTLTEEGIKICDFAMKFTNLKKERKYKHNVSIEFVMKELKIKNNSENMSIFRNAIYNGLFIVKRS